MKKKTTILSSLLLIGAIVFTSCGGGETTKNTENKTTGNNITGTFTDSRDGKTYKTVKIGQQVWMSENLNFELKDSSCCYKNDPPNCNKYGRLYKWKTALKICPSGCFIVKVLSV